jgi:Fe2+ or Zn2+ uptake regulation protein
VPPEDRREAVLKFIYEHDMALPPLAIFAGLKRQQGIHFSYRTVQNILSDLMDAGLVDTTKLREGEGIQPVDGGSGRRSYYFITEEGRKRVSD